MSERDPVEHQGAMEHLVGVVLYAPLGFALEARNLLPLLVDRGRGQVKLARATGRRALERRQKWVSDQAAQANRALGAAGRGLGLVAGSEAEAPDDGDDGAPVSSDDPAVKADGSLSTPVPFPPADRPPPDPDGEPGIDAATLAIPDYDSLSASQVVPRLAALSDPELELVLRYERGGRGRRTILNKISQLRSG